jgi:hypothetical protein
VDCRPADDVNNVSSSSRHRSKQHHTNPYYTYKRVPLLLCACKERASDSAIDRADSHSY